jgi:hypothetical protein
MWRTQAIGLAFAAITAGTVTAASLAQPKPPSPGVAVAALATGPGCITQSSFGTERGERGNFEVVVLQGTRLVHYWHPNGEPTLAWHRGQMISQSATGPGCIIQSDIGTGSGHAGNLEVVVQEGDHVTHYFHNSSAPPSSPWIRGLSFGQGVTGGPSIIQSDFKSGAHGNFEVVVPEAQTSCISGTTIAIRGSRGSAGKRSPPPQLAGELSFKATSSPARTAISRSSSMRAITSATIRTTIPTRAAGGSSTVLSLSA